MKQQISTIYRTWQGIAQRLRRRGAVVSLIALLTLGLIEPLACILHCEIQTLMAQPDVPLLHHQHHASGVLATTSMAVATVSAPMGCPFFHGPAAPACETTAPQPFHEMALLPLVLLPLIARRRRTRPAPGTVPPTRALSPHFRPPILCV